MGAISSVYDPHLRHIRFGLPRWQKGRNCRRSSWAIGFRRPAEKFPAPAARCKVNALNAIAGHKGAMRLKKAVDRGKIRVERIASNRMFSGLQQGRHDTRGLYAASFIRPAQWASISERVVTQSCRAWPSGFSRQLRGSPLIFCLSRYLPPGIGWTCRFVCPPGGCSRMANPTQALKYPVRQPKPLSQNQCNSV